MNEIKETLGKKIVSLKRTKGWSWGYIGQQLGHSPVWVCAACLGQMSMKPETAAKAASLFGLSEEERAVLELIPYRGSISEMPPTDPLIYRFYELISVYETTI